VYDHASLRMSFLHALTFVNSCSSSASIIVNPVQTTIFAILQQCRSQVKLLTPCQPSANRNTVKRAETSQHAQSERHQHSRPHRPFDRAFSGRRYATPTTHRDQAQIHIKRQRRRKRCPPLRHRRQRRADDREPRPDQA
jgi:hypothetical protein